MVPSGYLAVLQTLVEHDVEFIVVGGIAAVLLAAPVMTFDLDLVHSRSQENVAKLLPALRAMNAHYRHRPEIVPNESHLVTVGHQLLEVASHKVDILGAIGNGLTYEDLLPHSELVEFSQAFCVRVLDLETQIAVKEQTGRDKDLAVLPTLRATLAESRRLKRP